MPTKLVLPIYPWSAAIPQPIRSTRHVWLQQVLWVTLVEPVEQHEFIVCPDADAQPGDDYTRASQLRRGLVHRHRRIAYPEMHVMEAHGLRLIGTLKGHETHEGGQ